MAGLIGSITSVGWVVGSTKLLFYLDAEPESKG